MKEVVAKKYTIDEESKRSDWNVYYIFGLFGAIAFYALVSIGLNLLAFRFMPRRLHTREFLKKRSSIIWATTTITLAAFMGITSIHSDQNFIVMASGLFVEYLWLLAVILISLLLRVSGDQIKSAFHIYAPLLVIGFVVITFRIILIPSELVSIAFPPVLMACMFWQWMGIRKHNRNIPRSDMFYTYVSLTVFLASVVCSWAGYTLLSVQLLIWWIMQLTCILTITCISDYLRMYEEKHGFAQKPVTQTWFYSFIHKVVMPVLIVGSVMLSIYWAADVFNLSDMCWQIFNYKFINQENLQVSIIKLAIVISLWFLFSYLTKTILSLMRLHYEISDPTTAESRTVMSRKRHTAHCLGNLADDVAGLPAHQRQLATGHLRRTVNWYRFRLEGHHREHLLRCLAHGGPHQGGRLDRGRRHDGQGGEHQLHLHHRGVALWRDHHLPELAALRQKL